MNTRRPGSFRDDFTVSLTLVSPCEGVPTVKTFPPPPSPPASEAPSSEDPTVFLAPQESTPTVKRTAPAVTSASSIARPTPSQSAVAFVRGVVTGIAMTSAALLAIAIVMGAPLAWRGVSQVRPAVMHLVENVAARRADPEPNAKAEPVVQVRPKTSSHPDRVARERESRRPLVPSKRILEQAL